MTGWTGLHQELDRWGDSGRPATFWWRDDDAAAPSAALDRLLRLSARHAASLALAVIPEGCEDALAPVLSEAADRLARGKAGHAGLGPALAVLQHGIAHRNHAPAGEKNSELGQAPLPKELAARLTAGRDRLAGLFGGRFLPVLVPPWNRIAPDLLPALPALGFAGISTYRARPARFPVPGLEQVNTHADLLRWKPDRGFLGESEALTLLVTHLRGRRTERESGGSTPGGADIQEPTGILTHHLVHDAATWDFLERLLDLLARHPAATVLAPSAVFSHAAGESNRQADAAPGQEYRP